MPLTPSQHAANSRLGAHTSWGRTKDRTARTAPAREAFYRKFLAEAEGDPLRAESLRKAHYQRLAIKSARARQRRGAMDRTGTTRPGV
ncbi:hypothetical protein [Mycolicibacterium sp. CR10]|uniref:hypothetical protein n=1 Tax=Mycolicibacterium sp. CR10 TaxID=2562314 RepID=UPI0010C13170|nr:hypothetical protein [Mycolicibacterium sp. CR10]